MKNLIILIFVLILLGFSIANEPIEDTIDIIAGATNDTYGTKIDVYSGVSSESEEDEEDEEEDDEYDEDDD